jgi:hypothetical protein
MQSDIARVEKLVERAGHSINEWRLFAEENNLYESEFWIKMFLANPTKAFVGFMNWRARRKEEAIRGVPGTEQGQS